MYSDESSTDEGKRKRSEESDEIFGKSKKVIRAPIKNEMSGEKLEQMMEMMRGIMKEVKEIKENQNEYKEEIKKLKKENEQAKKENDKLKTEIRIINNRLENMEREKRRNNIVIQGLAVDSADTEILKQRMENFMDEYLGIQVKIKGARKLGEKICLLEMENSSEKSKVMRNKNKLKDGKEKNVYINDDMTKKDREIQGKIRRLGQEEKKKGKQVKTGYRKLTIDNQVYKWNEDKADFDPPEAKN